MASGSDNNELQKRQAQRSFQQMNQWAMTNKLSLFKPLLAKFDVIQTIFETLDEKETEKCMTFENVYYESLAITNLLITPDKFSEKCDITDNSIFGKTDSAYATEQNTEPRKYIIRYRTDH